MFYRSAFLRLGVIALSVCCAAQMDTFSNSRLGLPSTRDQSSAPFRFNSVSGNVTSADNRPLDNVRVELRSTNGSTVAAAYTNPAGSFEFPQVYTGMYEVVASLGVNQAGERIVVSGFSPNITLRLPVRGSAEDGNGSTSVSIAQLKVPEKARSAFVKAQEDSSKGRNDDARKQISKALEIYPRYADALTLRAILKMDAQDVQGAADDLQQAINTDSNCAVAYIVMGSVLNAQSKFDAAIRVLERGQSLAPNSWQAYFEMGKALLAKAQYEPALHQFERAQALVQNDYPVIHLAKARAMLALSNYTDATSELQAFLAKESQGPNTQTAQKMLAQAQAASATAGK